MQLTFLEAQQRLCKTIKKDGTMESYPLVKHFSSHQEKVKTIGDFKKAIENHAKKGHCLLKGNVQKQLINESRAGSTKSDEHTEWVCLDVDGANAPSPEVFLQMLGITSSAVVQYSNSMGLKPGLRCHIFLKLDKPQSPEMLKMWLTHLNLSSQFLSSQVSLTKTGNALLWPLDITTCQNDKLLYIAAPNLEPGAQDPFPNARIYEIKGTREDICFDDILKTLPPPTAIRVKTTETVDALRAAAGLPKRKSWELNNEDGVFYLPNPDEAIISDIKSERGFIYFNLNGGDSWAYYSPIETPEYVFNFKGEPTYRTEELLPTYWQQIQRAVRNAAAANQTPIYLAFREFRSALYYNGVYDPATRKLDLAQARSEGQLKQFLKQYGQAVPEFIRDWALVWEPNNPTVVDEKNFVLNTYKLSDVALQVEQKPPKPVGKAKVPPTIHKIIDSVTGNDPDTYDHFINWLAVIYQRRCMTGTAWVLHGTQGTGKGALMHQVLTPLFGAENVESKRAEELESEFTGFFENKHIVFIDEIEVASSSAQAKVTARLKNLIVEPTISIRRMYQPAYAAKNHANLIFASNQNQPVEVTGDDRRYNIAPYQARTISLSFGDINVGIPSELPEFAQFLSEYKADMVRARTPLVSEARTAMINVSKSSVETVCDYIRAGDFQAIFEFLPASAKDAAALPVGRAPLMMRLVGIMEEALENKTTDATKLTREEIYTILEFAIGGMPIAPAKFTQMLRHKKLVLKQVWKNQTNTRGVDVNWVIDEDQKESYLKHLASLRGR